MKKIVALLLVLVMVLPVCFSATAAETAETRPFVMLNWGGVEEGKYDNVFGAAFFWTDNKNVLDPIEVMAYSTVSLKKIAERTKEEFDKRPDGARAINLVALNRIFVYYADTSVYLDKGAEEMAEWLEMFLAEYSSIGGKLDGILVDLEYVGGDSYYVKKIADSDPLYYKKIMDHPSYQTRLRPLLEAQGFDFWDEISDYTPEIYSIAADREQCGIWDAAVSILKSQYINEAATDVMLKYYPNATLSDYTVADFKGWYRSTDDNSGNTLRAGNGSDQNMYFVRPELELYQIDGQYVFNSPDTSYVKAYYDQTPFNMSLHEINHFKNIYASTNEKLTATIGFYNYNSEGRVPGYYAQTASNTPYYSEIIFHMGLLNPERFNGYIYDEDVQAGNYGSYDEMLDVASQVLAELSRVAGAADRVPIAVPANWNSSYILSGMYAGGRNIWRITPDTAVVSVEDFKVEGADPTFYVNGQTITFPGGKIVEDGKIDAVGTCGYWVETAADVYPIVTSDADRFAQVPALKVDFENWTAGAFDFNGIYPVGGWELKKGDKTSEATVISAENGQALSFTGNITLSNVKMPANIYAGDGYAEQQAWQVTVTVPEGLANDAEIVLLNYAGSKQSAKDGGFKIAGGKLYYGIAGEKDAAYEELTALSAGTYTLRRELNFTTEGAYTCDYYVFDAEGKEIKSVKAVAVPAFTGAANSVSFKTVNADKAVTIDDYQIALNSAYADLTLYDEVSGRQLEDQSAAHSANTAYRLSWLNASNATATAQVIAAVYEGETLVSETVVKEITMLPGCDQIETGIVEVGEGQSVKVYLKTEAGEAAGGGMSTTLLIVVIAAVVVVAAAVVVALVVVKKNNTTEDDETEEETEETEE